MQRFLVMDGGKSGTMIVQKELFERDCLLRVASEYSHEMYIDFEPEGDAAIKVHFRAKDGFCVTDDVLRDFANELVDQQVRLGLEKQFGAIRNMIVEQAFSPTRK